MSGVERRSGIIRILDHHDVVRPTALADSFAVSVETIRRDLVVLEQLGDVQRVHGGVARSRLSNNSEPARSARLGLHWEAKQEIAATMASLVSDDATVIFDVGTTVEACAHALAESFRGLVITNSWSVVAECLTRPEVSVQFLGGKVRKDEMTCAGPEAIHALSQLHADFAVLGSGGVDASGGLTDYDVEELLVRQQMLRSASSSYVVADASKIGHVALRKVCALDALSGVVTDKKADAELVHALRELGVQVIDGPAGTENGE